MSKVAHALAACAVMAALASCGGSSGVSAASYVKSVCTTGLRWQNAIRNAGLNTQAAIGSKSLAQEKSGYVSLMGAIVTATSRATDQLAAAGTPKVSGGKSVSTRLVDVFSKARTGLAQAASEAKSLPTTSAGAFNAAARKLQTNIRNSLAQLSSVSPANNPQLRSAAANDSTCRSLASGG